MHPRGLVEVGIQSCLDSNYNGRDLEYVGGVLNMVNPQNQRFRFQYELGKWMYMVKKMDDLREALF